MEIFEIATMLGKALKEDERLKALEKAKIKYQKSEKLSQYMAEYQSQQEAMQSEIAKKDRDMHFIEIVQERIDELYKLISDDEDYIELNKAQEAVTKLMDAVNNIITFNITGENPCTHDCSSCGGGCHR